MIPCLFYDDNYLIYHAHDDKRCPRSKDHRSNILVILSAVSRNWLGGNADSCLNIKSETRKDNFVRYFPYKPRIKNMSLFELCVVCSGLFQVVDLFSTAEAQQKKKSIMLESI